MFVIMLYVNTPNTGQAVLGVHIIKVRRECRARKLCPQRYDLWRNQINSFFHFLFYNNRNAAHRKSKDSKDQKTDKYIIPTLRICDFTKQRRRKRASYVAEGIQKSCQQAGVDLVS